MYIAYYKGGVLITCGMFDGNLRSFMFKKNPKLIIVCVYEMFAVRSNRPINNDIYHKQCLVVKNFKRSYILSLLCIFFVNIAFDNLQGHANDTGFNANDDYFHKRDKFDKSSKINVVFFFS